MLVEIYGASDDLVEISGCPGADEFCNASSGSIKFSGNLVYEPDSGDKEVMRIHVLYDESGPEASGCWSVAVGQADEDIPFPDWLISILPHERGYSTLTVIEVPDGTYLVPDAKYRNED